MLCAMTRRPSARDVVAAIDRLGASGPTDLREFRAAALEVLRRAIGFDWYVWVLTGPRRRPTSTCSPGCCRP